MQGEDPVEDPVEAYLLRHLVEVMLDNQQVGDRKDLPTTTGFPEHMEQCLSSIFVDPFGETLSPQGPYGTRTTTILLVKDDSATYLVRDWNPVTRHFESSTFRFYRGESLSSA